MVYYVIYTFLKDYLNTPYFKLLNIQHLGKDILQIYHSMQTIYSIQYIVNILNYSGLRLITKNLRYLLSIQKIFNGKINEKFSLDINFLYIFIFFFLDIFYLSLKI